jgi:hypothetical protein
MGQESGVELNLEPGRAAVEPTAADRVVAEPMLEPSAEPDELLLSRISLEAEVPEVLFDGMREFIRSHPQWDQYRLITAALASFLFQNGSRDACVAQHYLNGLVLR